MLHPLPSVAELKSSAKMSETTAACTVPGSASPDSGRVSAWQAAMSPASTQKKSSRTRRCTRDIPCEASRPRRPRISGNSQERPAAPSMTFQREVAGPDAHLWSVGVRRFDTRSRSIFPHCLSGSSRGALDFTIVSRRSSLRVQRKARRKSSTLGPWTTRCGPRCQRCSRRS
jgi:hypothetical protein